VEAMILDFMKGLIFKIIRKINFVFVKEKKKIKNKNNKCKMGIKVYYYRND